MKKNPLVVIRCLVYNHEPYLRDCFDGFVMQQTNFPFVAIVHDDASTDNSVKIIREYEARYPHIFKPIYETENQFSKNDGSLIKIMNNAIDSTNAEYIAMCEGDDFWTDPLKLQKQVDILEKDKTLMGVCSDTSVVDVEGNILKQSRGEVVRNNIEGRYNLRDFFKYEHQYPTASVVYRRTHQEEIREKYLHTKNQFLGDWNLWICLHLYGDFYYLNEPMVAYRINPTSLTHTCNHVERTLANRHICLSVAEILPDEYSDIRDNLRNLDWIWVKLIFAFKHEKKYLRMIGSFIMSVLTCPIILWNTFVDSKFK